MLTTAQKEHLTYTAVGQTLTLFVMCLIGYLYILPGIDTINTAVSTANTSIETYKKTEKDGLSFSELMGTIGARTEYAELKKIISADIEGSKKVIQKSGDAKYLDWLKSSIGNSTEEKKLLIQEKKKLNSIIATLSPVSSNIEEDNITLKGYIRYIEGNILKKFNLTTNVVLGIDSITLGGGNSGIPETVGSFTLQIAFKAKNRDINDFIGYIKRSGNPDILLKDEILTQDKIPSVMQNPLITIDDFGLQENIHAGTNPTKENSGRITVRFYVRGISKDDVIYLKENIKLREDELNTELATAIKECNSILCATVKKELEIFNKKYQEYKTNAPNIAPNTGTNIQIQSLAQRSRILKSLENEFQKLTEAIPNP